MKLNRLLFLLVLLHQYGFAQTATEVYLLDIKKNKTSFSIVSNSKLINISNNAGYDNQPNFIEKLNAVAFVSSRNTKPTDVYLYNLANANTKQFTNNKEAEYSPKTTPDDKYITR